MPWKKIVPDPEPKDLQANFYFCKVPKALLDRVEKHRVKMRHNKTAATVTMMEMYLKLQVEEKVNA